MARRGTVRGMPQAIPQRRQIPDFLIQFVRFRFQASPIDVRRTVRTEHRADVVQAKPRLTSQGDQGQALDNIVVKNPAHAFAANGFDQPFFFVEAQRGRWKTGFLR